MSKYSGMKFSVSADGDGLSVAYIAIEQEGRDRPKTFKNIDLKSVLPQTKGPQIILDVDEDNNILGIEVIL